MADAEIQELNETDPEFRERFRRESSALLVSRTRLAIAFSAIAYPGFWLLDRFAAPDYWIDFLWIRLAVIAFYCLILVVMSRSFGERVAIYASIAGVYVSGLGICLMIPVMGGYQSDYYIGVMLIIFVSGLVFPWNALETGICGGLIVASYFVVNILFGSPLPNNLYHIAAPSFFMVASVVFAVFGNYSTDRSRRRDLALRMRVEKHAAELAQLDEAKTRFFSNVSHELRTPLTLILGPLESILQGRETEDIRPLLEAMDSNARRLLRQVNAILDFSKLDAGKLRLDLAPNNAGILLRELVDAAVPHAERKGVTLTREGCDDLPDSIFDLDKIENVAANLLSNALKFTFEGSVTLRAGYDEETIWFDVVDTGPGIPEDNLKSIFERFQQVDDSMSRKAEGTGLGLAMVRELTEMHGGSVQVESEVGVGTSFHVEFPREPDVPEENRIQPGHESDRAKAAAANATGRESSRQTLLADVAGGRLASLEASADGAAVETAPEAPEGAYTVLIVEDNPDLRGFVSRSLAKTYKVYTAADGVFGFEAAKKYSPDLIVSDIMMPRMNGYQLCRLVRQDAELSRTPFILVTAKSGAEAVVEGLEIGADDYLTKPFDIRELDARISAHLRAVKLERSLGERDSRLAAIGQMTGSIVHDLRNPTQSIIGFAEVAQLVAAQEGRKQIAERLNPVINEAHRLGRMITEVLDFAKGGVSHLQCEPVHVKGFLDELAGPLGDLLKAWNIELVLAHVPDASLSVFIDRNRVQRVFENLVRNAREAIEQVREGTDERHIWVEVTSDADTARIRVTDDGPGIPEEMVATLFDAFATQGKANGTGLGLSTVRNLMKAHGGDVEVQPKSERGGASFLLTFPRSISRERRDRGTTRAAEPHRPSPSTPAGDASIDENASTN